MVPLAGYMVPVYTDVLKGLTAIGDIFRSLTYNSVVEILIGSLLMNVSLNEID